MEHADQQISDGRTDIRAHLLCYRRMTAARPYKVALAIAIAISVSMASLVLAMRALGDVGPYPGVVGRTANLLMVLSGGIVALWRARGGVSVSDDDPYIQLAEQHGISLRNMLTASSVVATLSTSAIIWLWTAPVVVMSAATSPSSGTAAAQFLMLLPLLVLALVAGIVLGWLPLQMSRLFPRHGLSAFILLIALPPMLDGWLLPSQAGLTSITGVLHWLVDWMIRTGAPW